MEIVRVTGVSSYRIYLLSQLKNVEDHEKFVNILLDDIYVKADLQYTSVVEKTGKEK